MTKWAYVNSTVKIKIKNRILIEEEEVERHHGKEMLDEKKHGNISEGPALARALLLTPYESQNWTLCQLTIFI